MVVDLEIIFPITAMIINAIMYNTLSVAVGG